MLESWDNFLLMDDKGADKGTPVKEKKELSPLDKIQQVVGAKKKKDAEVRG